MEHDTGSGDDGADRWARVPEALIYDHRVSGNAVRVYAALSRFGSTPATCYPKLATIAELIGAKPRSVPAWVRELEAAGWVTRHPRLKADGSPDSNGYDLGGYAPASAGGTRQPARRVRAEERGGSAPRSAPKESHGTRATERETPLPPAAVLPLDLPAARANGGSWMLAFDEFWSAYPRKQGKQEARRAWNAALRRGADPGAIVAGARRYAADPNREPEFTKMAQGWLNGGRWADDPLPERTGGLSRTQRAARASRARRDLAGAAFTRDSVVSLPATSVVREITGGAP